MRGQIQPGVREARFWQGMQGEQYLFIAHKGESQGCMTDHG
ncbi:Uncharacterized protein dnm_002420 [Desulfonema magnum]|uniref:Uncharacterized protein n=1 Tax=Desulfonema magnum TaxID=45655 RepID=A0A975BFA4_9BACT|nr:Uncharacterized protein dnm_002420 [Desulfonema magnum]